MMLKHRRYDVRTARKNGYRVEIYWRADELGVGPCMSLYVGKRETIRFDLFDPPHKHFKCNPNAPRIYYPTDLPFPKLVEVAIEDLVLNFPKAVKVAGWAGEQLLQVQGPIGAP